MELKGELLRKRYFLIDLGKEWNILPVLEKDLFRTFNAKWRFRKDPYFIFLTDQFQKEFVSAYLNKHYPSVKIVSVSGTIRKLKSHM